MTEPDCTTKWAFTVKARKARALRRCSYPITGNHLRLYHELKNYIKGHEFGWSIGPSVLSLVTMPLLCAIFLCLLRTLWPEWRKRNRKRKRWKRHFFCGSGSGSGSGNDKISGSGSGSGSSKSKIDGSGSGSGSSKKSTASTASTASSVLFFGGGDFFLQFYQFLIG